MKSFINDMLCIVINIRLIVNISSLQCTRLLIKIIDKILCDTIYKGIVDIFFVARERLSLQQSNFSNVFIVWLVFADILQQVVSFIRFCTS